MKRFLLLTSLAGTALLIGSVMPAHAQWNSSPYNFQNSPYNFNNSPYNFKTVHIILITALISSTATAGFTTRTGTVAGTRYRDRTAGSISSTMTGTVRVTCPALGHDKI
jgi:hypothetical protein